MSNDLKLQALQNFEDGVTPTKWAAARIRELEAERDRLQKAGDWLSYCAQTSGGTAGRDDDLVEAINGWAAARAALQTDTGG